MPSLCHENNGVFNKSDVSDNNNYFSIVNDNRVVTKSNVRTSEDINNHNNSINWCLYNSYDDGGGGGGGGGTLYSSSCSINTGFGDREKILFIGFEESWERDLWSTWLIQVNYFYVNKLVSVTGHDLYFVRIVSENDLCMHYI